MKKFYLIVIILCSIHFWGWIRLTTSFHNITNVITLGIMMVSMAKMLPNNQLGFRFAVLLYIIGLICNIISAKVNNGQSIRDTAFSGFHFYFIILYFFLHQEKVDKKDMENIIIIFAVLFAFFYLRQVKVFPERLFSGNMFRDRGTVRIRIEGNGFLMLGYFMLLNKFLLQRKIWQIVLALFLFAILLKSGFRTLLAGAVVMSGITFIVLVKYSPVNYLMIVLATLMFTALLLRPGNAYILNSMITTTEEQQEEGDNYIRRMQYEYFTKVYPKNFSYYIVGGGLPGAKGSYAYYMGQLMGLYGFYWVDLGLIGFYFVMGLIALLGIFAYSLKAIFIKIPPDYFYLHMFFAYILIVSFTTMEIYRSGMFPVEAIALYLIDLGRIEYKQNKLEISNI